MGLHGPALVHHRRAVLEVADPQGAGLVPRPAAADDFLGDAQLPPRGPLLPQVPVEGGTRKLTPELPLQDAIDRFVGAERLLLLQDHGAVQQVAVLFPRLAPVASVAGDTVPARLRLSAAATGDAGYVPKGVSAGRWAAGVPLGSVAGNTARAAAREFLPAARGSTASTRRQPSLRCYNA